MKAEEQIRAIIARRTRTPITNSEICRRLKSRGIQISEAEVRYIVNTLRSRGDLPIVAGIKGYRVTYNKNEILGQIESMHQRIQLMRRAMRGLQGICNKL